MQSKYFSKEDEKFLDDMSKRVPWRKRFPIYIRGYMRGIKFFITRTVFINNIEKLKTKAYFAQIDLQMWRNRVEVDYSLWKLNNKAWRRLYRWQRLYRIIRVLIWRNIVSYFFYFLLLLSLIPFSLLSSLKADWHSLQFQDTMAAIQTAFTVGGFYVGMLAVWQYVINSRNYKDPQVEISCNNIKRNKGVIETTVLIAIINLGNIVVEKPRIYILIPKFFTLNASDVVLKNKEGILQDKGDAIVIIGEKKYPAKKMEIKMENLYPQEKELLIEFPIKIEEMKFKKSTFGEAFIYSYIRDTAQCFPRKFALKGEQHKNLQMDFLYELDI